MFVVSGGLAGTLPFDRSWFSALRLLFVVGFAALLVTPVYCLDCARLRSGLCVSVMLICLVFLFVF